MNKKIIILKETGSDKIRIEIDLDELLRKGEYHCYDSYGWNVDAYIEEVIT